MKELRRLVTLSQARTAGQQLSAESPGYNRVTSKAKTEGKPRAGVNTQRTCVGMGLMRNHWALQGLLPCSHTLPDGAQAPCSTGLHRQRRGSGSLQGSPRLASCPQRLGNTRTVQMASAAAIHLLLWRQKQAVVMLLLIQTFQMIFFYFVVSYTKIEPKMHKARQKNWQFLIEMCLTET